jgi:hypothetical protein
MISEDILDFDSMCIFLAKTAPQCSALPDILAVVFRLPVDFRGLHMKAEKEPTHNAQRMTLPIQLGLHSGVS